MRTFFSLNKGNSACRAKIFWITFPSISPQLIRENIEDIFFKSAPLSPRLHIITVRPHVQMPLGKSDLLKQLSGGLLSGLILAIAAELEKIVDLLQGQTGKQWLMAQAAV